MYENVQLTDAELQASVNEAKQKKFWHLEDLKKQQQKLEAYTEARRIWSTEELFTHARQQAETLAGISKAQYRLDEHISPVFNLLCEYFSNNPSFEKDGRSLDKGILIMGDVGVGKTDLLKAFRKNKRQCFLPITCNEVEEKCSKHGYKYMQTYYGAVPGHGDTIDYFFHPQIGWMFDDLGTESPVRDYGNTFDAMEKIIHQRYMRKGLVPFSSMHITTNISSSAIDDRYGYRTRSRIREMFNIITLSGEDRRK